MLDKLPTEILHIIFLYMERIRNDRYNTILWRVSNDIRNKMLTINIGTYIVDDYYNLTDIDTLLMSIIQHDNILVINNRINYYRQLQLLYPTKNVMLLHSSYKIYKKLYTTVGDMYCDDHDAFLFDDNSDVTHGLTSSYQYRTLHTNVRRLKIIEPGKYNIHIYCSDTTIEICPDAEYQITLHGRKHIYCRNHGRWARVTINDKFEITVQPARKRVITHDTIKEYIWLPDLKHQHGIARIFNNAKFNEMIPNMNVAYCDHLFGYIRQIYIHKSEYIENIGDIIRQRVDESLKKFEMKKP